jgi:hypothetical protein
MNSRFDRQRVRVVLEVSWQASSTSRRLLLTSTSVNLCSSSEKLLETQRCAQQMQ